jgi:TRAP-type C4-dicarboxylate transport system permease small subunit
MMQKLFYVITAMLAKGFETISGVTLLCVVALTIADIVGRFFGKPVVGTYELVSAAGGLVVSFALPISIMEKKHVVIDLILEHVSIHSKIALHVITRLIAVTLFGLLTWSCMRMGQDLRSTGEVSSILQLPLYPLVYGMGGAFFGVFLALIDDMFKFRRFREGDHE